MTGKVFAFIGATVIGAIGWWIGSPIGFMTAFILSTIGSGIGIYLGKKLADHYGY